MTYRIHDVFTAIADPSRRQIIALLSKNEMTANAIANRFNISRPAVSKHLRILEKTSLVTTQQKGRYRIYKLNAEPLLEVKDWVIRYEKFWEARLQSLKGYCETGKGKPFSNH